MSEAKKVDNVCVCGVVPDEWEDECRSCDGTGDDEKDMCFPGCSTCSGKGFVMRYRCDCDPYGDADD